MVTRVGGWANVTAVWRWTSSAHIQQRSYSTRCREVVGKSPAKSSICLYPEQYTPVWLLEACWPDNLVTKMKIKWRNEGKGLCFSDKNGTCQQILPHSCIQGEVEWVVRALNTLSFPFSAVNAFQNDIKKQKRCNSNTKGRPCEVFSRTQKSNQLLRDAETVKSFLCLEFSARQRCYNMFVLKAAILRSTEGGSVTAAHSDLGTARDQEQNI